MDRCGVMLDPKKKRYIYSMLSIFGAISLSLLFFFLLLVVLFVQYLN